MSSWKYFNKGGINVNLEWIKCQGDVWCPLKHVDLNDKHFDELEGVYIIWYKGIYGQVIVRIG